MKILFLSSVYPSPDAPVCGTYNEQLCRSLARRHAVRVVAPRPCWRAVVGWWKRRGRRGQTAAEPAADSVHPEAVEGDTAPTGSSAGCASAPPRAVPVTRPTYFYTPKLFRRFYGQFLWWSVRWHVQAVLEEFRPDCVLSYWVDPDGEAARRAARQAGIPAAVFVGGSDVLVLTANAARRRRVCHTLRGLDAVFCVSEGLRRVVVELGAEPERVHTVYQGVDRSLFCPESRSEARRTLGLPADQRVLLWVGRLVPVKGLDVLTQAFATACTWNRALHLYLVGGGPLRDELQRQVERLHVADRVHFVGPVPYEQTPLWYRAANATVLSSWSEGLPNVLRESLACGTPFVSTNVGSVSEIADPSFSILVPPGDVETLADALLRIGDERYRLGAAQYRPRSWDDAADEVAERLQALCARRRSGRATVRPASRCPAEAETATPAECSETSAAASVGRGSPQPDASLPEDATALHDAAASVAVDSPLSGGRPASPVAAEASETAAAAAETAAASATTACAESPASDGAAQ